MVAAGAKTAKGKLDGMGLAQDHGGLAAQGLEDGALGGPDLGQGAGGSSKGRQSGDAVQIFDRHRHTVQAAQRQARGAGGVGVGIGSLSLSQGQIGSPGDIGVQGRVVAGSGMGQKIGGAQRPIREVTGDVAQAVGKDRGEGHCAGLSKAARTESGVGMVPVSRKIWVKWVRVSGSGKTSVKAKPIFSRRCEKPSLAFAASA